MISNLDISNALAIVVTGVQHVQHFEDLDVRQQKLWEQHAEKWFPNVPFAQSYMRNAGYFAEFSRIQSIGFGSFEKWGKNYQLKVKTFTGSSEETVVKEAVLFINKHIRFKEQVMVSHGGRDQDFPFLSRRIVVHRVQLPECLKVGNKAPWELNLLDTQEIWKFGAIRHQISIEALATCMGINIPHFDRTEADIRNLFFENPDHEVIKEFTANKVICLSRILIRFKDEGQLPDNLITIS